MTDLLSLAARCEAAEGPSPALDEEILAAVSLNRKPRRAQPGWWRSRKAIDKMKSTSFTASLDAAATLVPERHWWAIDEFLGETSAIVSLAGADAAAYGFQCFGASAAIALCAAALRARATQRR